MKIGIFSDLHVDEFKDLEDNRLDYLYEKIDEMLMDFLAKDVQYVLFVGDWYNKRNHNAICKDFTTKVLRKFSNNNIHIYAIAGNHETDLKSESINHLTQYNNLQLNFKALPNGEYGLGAMKIFAINNTTLQNAQKLLKQAENIKKETNGINILMLHQDIIGAKNTKHFEAKNGLSMQQIKDAAINFDLVVCGHYHMSEIIRPKILFTGSFIQNNFGEEENVTGYWIYNTDAHDIKKITLF